MTTIYFSRQTRLGSVAILASLFLFSWQITNAATLTQTLDDPTVTGSDRYGGGVALSGDYIFVGANNDNTSGPGVGQAHLYDANSGTLIQTFSDPVITSGDQFGQQGAIDGDHILIGDYGDDTTGFNEGSAHIFDAVTGNLLQTFYNPASIINGLFGLSVDINDGKAIIGAPLDGVGKAYLFDAASGALLYSFSDPSPTSADSFGRFVAIDGNLVIVGDPLDDTLGTNTGRVHIFNATTGGLLLTIDNPFPSNDEYFGWTLDVDGTNVLVAAIGDDSNGGNVGQAYVFDAITGALLQTLDDPTPTNSDSLGNFGAELDGSLAVIGASGDDTNGNAVGQAYVYDITTGLLIDTLDDPTPTNGDQFGWSVDIYGTTVVVGAHMDDTQGSDVGQVHLFDLGNSNTTEPGTNVEVVPDAVDENGDPIGENPVSFQFDEVTGGGETTVTVTGAGTPPPSGFRIGNPPTYFELETTATFSGNVELCISYAGVSYGNESKLALLHNADGNGGWVDITTTLDTSNDIICGSTSSFSEFAVFEQLTPEELLLELKTQTESINANNGVLNSLDGKLNAVENALADTNENNDGAAANALEAFISTTENQATNGKIGHEEATSLIQAAEEIIDVLS